MMIASRASFRESGLKQTILYARQANRINPSKGNQNWLGEMYYLNNEYDRAVEVFEKQVLDDPTDHSALNNYGYMLAHTGELITALMVCEEACRISRNHNNLDSLGFIHMSMGRIKESIVLFEEALELCPAHKEAVYHLDEAKARLRESEASV